MVPITVDLSDITRSFFMVALVCQVVTCAFDTFHFEGEIIFVVPISLTLCTLGILCFGSSNFILHCCLYSTLNVSLLFRVGFSSTNYTEKGSIVLYCLIFQMLWPCALFPHFQFWFLNVFFDLMILNILLQTMAFLLQFRPIRHLSTILLIQLLRIQLLHMKSVLSLLITAKWMPPHQFGFRNQHTTVQQTHSLCISLQRTSVASCSLCCS
jgi:hypothetical protein